MAILGAEAIGTQTQWAGRGQSLHGENVRRWNLKSGGEVFGQLGRLPAERARPGAAFNSCRGRSESKGRRLGLWTVEGDGQKSEARRIKTKPGQKGSGSNLQAMSATSTEWDEWLTGGDAASRWVVRGLPRWLQ